MIDLSMTQVSHGFHLPDESWLPVLHNIDLTIPAGSHVSIVGPSGSGKSTLLNIMGLLDMPAQGDYLLDGKDVRTYSNRALAKKRGETFGFVFQQFNLLPGRTALENVAAPLLYSTGKQFWLRKKYAAEMLDRVGLSHRLSATPERLSGGEQQRVAIARALVRRPAVLLADEPTGALDVDTGIEIINLLESLIHENGSTLVAITHDTSIAKRAKTQFRISRGELTSVIDVAEATPLDAAAPPDADTLLPSASADKQVQL